MDAESSNGPQTEQGNGASSSGNMLSSSTQSVANAVEENSFTTNIDIGDAVTSAEEQSSPIKSTEPSAAPVTPVQVLQSSIGVIAVTPAEDQSSTTGSGSADGFLPDRGTGDRIMPTTPVIIKTSSFYSKAQRMSTVSPVGSLIRDLHPLPKAPLRARKRTAQSAEILTSSPYKKSVVEKQVKRKPSKAKPETSSKSGGKKQTCRKDKPIGRRPKGQTASKTTRITTEQKRAGRKEKINRRLKNTVPNDDSDDEVSCAGCGENFSESTDKWVQCRRCDLWYELVCAGLIGKSTAIQNKFICEQC